MIKIQRLISSDNTLYKCEGMEIMVPFSEPSDEAEASVIKVFKRKLADRWANGLQFEITTVELSKLTSVSIERATESAVG